MTIRELCGYQIYDDMVPENDSGLDVSSTADANAVDIMVVQLVICVVGVLANLVVIAVILILRDYRKTLTHWYVLQLAIADCTFLLTIPFDYSEAVYGAWIYSNGMCKVKETVLFLNYHSSILLLVIMSLDRYIAVCHSRSDIQTKLRNQRVAIIATAMVWGLSLIFCIPIMMYSTKILTDPDKGICGCGYLFPHDFRSMCMKDSHGLTVDECAEQLRYVITSYQEVCVNGNGSEFAPRMRVYDYPIHSGDYSENGSSDDYSGSGSGSGNGNVDEPTPHICSYEHRGAGWFSYLRFLFIGMFIIPLMIMTYCYTCIIRQLRRTRIRQTIPRSEDRRVMGSLRKRRLSASSEKANKKITRVNVTCILLVVTFIMCWLPFHSQHMAVMNGIRASEEFCDKLHKVTSLLIFLNSALNPFIYNLIGTKFSNRLIKAAGTMKSSIRRTSVSSSRGNFVRYRRRQNSSRNSSHGVTVNTTANRSHSSNGLRSGANWSTVALPGSTADPEQVKIPLKSTDSESPDS